MSGAWLKAAHVRVVCLGTSTGGVHTPLSWRARMHVAVGTAKGMAYLHEESQPCVIHRDLKASNILLDSSFSAKVADFGLAKPAPDSPDGWVSTRVMGTFG